MLIFYLFLISFISSTLGSIVGAGGGVIIKPVVDMLGLLPVSVCSFASGITVLAMSCFSLYKSRTSNIKLNIKISTALAISAIIGGLIGKQIFEMIKSTFNNENLLGLIQSIILCAVTIIIIIYIYNKNKIKSFHVTNLLIILLIGLFLGIISSFLGIGGGPYNVAVLFLFFSMEAKEAAKNSIFIIMCSQISSLALSIFNHTIPDVDLSFLPYMALGGIGGAYIGSIVTKKIDSKQVEFLLKLLCFIIVGINIFNIIKFSKALL